LTGYGTSFRPISGSALRANILHFTRTATLKGPSARQVLLNFDEFA
jgi:hypothetical protein